MWHRQKKNKRKLSVLVGIAKKYQNAEVVGRVQKGDGVLLEPGNILYDHY